MSMCVFKNKRAQTHFEQRKAEEEEENKEEELCFDSFDKICNSRLLGHWRREHERWSARAHAHSFARLLAYLLVLALVRSLRAFVHSVGRAFVRSLARSFVVLFTTTKVSVLVFYFIYLFISISFCFSRSIFFRLLCRHTHISYVIFCVRSILSLRPRSPSHTCICESFSCIHTPSQKLFDDREKIFLFHYQTYMHKAGLVLCCYLLCLMTVYYICRMTKKTHWPTCYHILLLLI